MKVSTACLRICQSSCTTDSSCWLHAYVTHTGCCERFQSPCVLVPTSVASLKRASRLAVYAIPSMSTLCLANVCIQEGFEGYRRHVGRLLGKSSVRRSKIAAHFGLEMQAKLSSATMEGIVSCYTTPACVQGWCSTLVQYCTHNFVSTSMPHASSLIAYNPVCYMQQIGVRPTPAF